MSWKWFGVKTLYRSDATGRRKVTHPNYDPKTTLVEERIVLFRARTGQEAIRKAELEAREYARLSHTNSFGQRVRTKIPSDVIELGTIIQQQRRRSHRVRRAHYRNDSRSPVRECGYS